MTGAAIRPRARGKRNDRDAEALFHSVELTSIPTRVTTTHTLQAAALQAKLAKKAELQKKAAQPRTFTESFSSERAKQKEFNDQSKQARREAMCEELGRGC